MRKLWLFGASLLLAGCSTLDADKCRMFDWYGLGRDHGAQGSDPSALDRYAHGCAEFGVGVDRGAYARGHALGVSYYCTVDSAYGRGRVNERLNTRICHEQDWPKLEYAWAMGKEYYRAQGVIEDLQEALDDAREQRQAVEGKIEYARENFRQDEIIGPHARDLIRAYEREELQWRNREWDLERDIRDAERQLDRLEIHHRRELLEFDANRAE